jgi:hypothetical protein
MLRRVMWAALLFAACGSPSPRSRVARLYAALDAHDANGVTRTLVSGALARQLLDCADYAPYDHEVERAQEHARREEEEVQRSIKSFTGEDQATMWQALRPGDRFGNCKVRKAFAVEKYRVVLERHDRFRASEPSYPVELWHVSDDWFVADDAELDNF